MPLKDVIGKKSESFFLYIPNSSTLYTQALQMKLAENESFQFVPQNQGGYQQSSGTGRSFDTNNHSVEYWTRAVTSQFTQQDRRVL